MWGLWSDHWNNIGWLNHFEARSVDELDKSRKVEGVLYNSITKQATNIPNFTKSSLYVYVCDQIGTKNDLLSKIMTQCVY